MDDCDAQHSQSLTVTIQLDCVGDPQPSCSNKVRADGTEAVAIFSFNEPPPSAADFMIGIPPHLRVADIKKLGMHQLELYLNPPSYGSMLNWEYIASEFNFPSHKIMHLRSMLNPTDAVLSDIANCSLGSLVGAICKLNRVDILLVLQPYLQALCANHDLTTHTNNDSGAYVDSDRGSSNSAFMISRCSALSDVKAHLPGSGKFILVTHHENASNAYSRKNYKWLLKNLRKHAKNVNICIFDIQDYLEANTDFDGLHKLFSDALQIVCVFSEDYAQMLRCKPGNQDTVVKQYLHKLMNVEFVEQTGQNRRFRAVIFEGTERDVIPLGWARSTLVYEFPAHHVQLFKKLFVLE